jgi:hypothetical protein
VSGTTPVNDYARLGLLGPANVAPRAGSQQARVFYCPTAATISTTNLARNTFSQRRVATAATSQRATSCLACGGVRREYCCTVLHPAASDPPPPHVTPDLPPPSRPPPADAHKLMAGRRLGERAAMSGGEVGFADGAFWGILGHRRRHHVARHDRSGRALYLSRRAALSSRQTRSAREPVA